MQIKKAKIEIYGHPIEIVLCVKEYGDNLAIVEQVHGLYNSLPVINNKWQIVIITGAHVGYNKFEVGVRKLNGIRINFIEFSIQEVLCQ